MPSTVSPPFTTAPRSARDGDALVADPIHAARPRRSDRKRTTLARYLDGDARRREVVAQAACEGSVLVVDRDAATLGDRRLVAHLWADEPPENATLVCASYVDQVRREGCRCRPLAPADLDSPPIADHGEQGVLDGGSPNDDDPLDRLGRTYRLQPLRTGMSIPELRWRRHSLPPHSEQGTVSLREVIAALESYEPVRTITTRALAPGEQAISTAVLRAELTRVRLSPIVLNRGLREAALQRIERENLSLSEIAIRCGRVKRDASGNECGETSWLARRLGLLPEGGKDAPTPWIHSDVLALIARRGLGISPREAEVA